MPRSGRNCARFCQARVNASCTTSSGSAFGASRRASRVIAQQRRPRPLGEGTRVRRRPAAPAPVARPHPVYVRPGTRLGPACRLFPATSRFARRTAKLAGKSRAVVRRSVHRTTSNARSCPQLVMEARTLATDGRVRFSAMRRIPDGLGFSRSDALTRPDGRTPHSCEPLGRHASVRSAARAVRAGPGRRYGDRSRDRRRGGSACVLGKCDQPPVRRAASRCPSSVASTSGRS